MRADALEFIAIALATFISEDLTCIATGMAAAAGHSLPLGIVACTTGIFIGDLLLFALGRLGRPALQKAPLRFLVSADAIDRATAWFSQRGKSAILLSRFIPGLRLPTYVAAGIVHMPLVHFLPWFALGALLWTPLLVISSFFAGAKLTGFAGDRAPLLLGLTAILLYGLLRVALQMATWKGRRILAGWLLRWRWEYWPSWAAYIPVVLYCMFLAVKFRGAFLFTCCNPGIPASGITGESKSDILARLESPQTARFELLTPEKRSRVLELAEEWGWPIVLKPDRGQRGSGVMIVRSAAKLPVTLDTSELIAQEYIEGPEFGIFYARRPSEQNGRILSITRKILPELKGNGKSTIEELILADSRAVALWAQVCRANQERLHLIPAPGERIRLVELGTHSRGAIFLDGMHLWTPELSAAVDHISKRFKGFFIGRYDIRCPDEESLQRGKHLRILELNGATSEPTHIYDPSVSIVAAYRAMFEQWRCEYQIGNENRRLGARPLSARQLIRLLRTGRPESTPGETLL